MSELQSASFHINITKGLCYGASNRSHLQSGPQAPNRLPLQARAIVFYVETTLPALQTWKYNSTKWTR